MILHILDTDVLSLYQHGHPIVLQKALGTGPLSLAVAVISVEEQLSGWYTALRNAKQRAELARIYKDITDCISFYSRMQIVSFSESAIALYEGLRKQRLNVSKMDLRIAAIVLDRGAILVTRNSRDFQRVPGLQIENWTV